MDRSRGWKLVLAAFLAVLAWAQALDPGKRLTEFRLERWDSTKGFPAQAATDILQSRTGHLWIATFNGLARFDGRDFRLFQPGNTPAMATGNLWSLCEDAQGVLWIGTTGRELYRMEGGNVQQVPLAGPIGSVLKLAVAAQGGLWVGSNKGLFRLAQGQLIPAPDPELAKADVTALLNGKEGRLWVATRRKGLWKVVGDHSEGPFLVKPPGKTPEILSLAEGSEGEVYAGTLGQGVQVLKEGSLRAAPWSGALAEPTVGCLLWGARGELWIGGNHGLHRWVSGDMQHLGEKEGFPEERIQSLTQDREGNLWVGSWRDGLLRLSNGKFRIFAKQGGLPHNTVLAVEEDAQGALWVGTHAGLARIDARGIDPLKDLNRRLPASRDIKDLTFDRQGVLWISTLEEVFRIRGREIQALRNAKGEPLVGVRVLLESRFGGLWLGTSTGLLRSTNGKLEAVPLQGSPGPEPFVLSLYEEPSGRLWIGTRAHGLLCLQDGQRQAFTTKDGLPSDSVFRITPDEDGGLWIGTANGLARRREGRFQTLHQRNGLLGGAVYQVLPAGQDRLWLLAERGFLRLSKAEVVAALEGRIPKVEGKAFDEGDGLRIAACTSTSRGLRTRDGRVAIPTPGGLVVAEPGELPTNPRPPPVSIDALVRDQQEILFPSGRQVIPPGSRDLELHFSAPSLVAPEKVRFRYRLEPYDPGWHDPGTRHFALYNQLDPGTYRFTVNACNNDGVWSKQGAVLVLEIQPRFHQTWTFRALVLALLGGAVFWVLRIRMRALKAQALALEAQVEARTRELAEANEALRNQSLTDPLTGLRNRRYLGVCMPEDIAQVNRAQRQAEWTGADRFALNIDLLFIMVDVDHFKEVNDTYGHQAGDRVLQQLADILRRATRDTDTLIRWGGEEFLVVGRNASRKDVGELVERIRSEVEAHPFEIGPGQVIHRTCSLGFTFFPFLPSGPDFLTWEAVVDLADTCLYAAKRAGRNAWVGLSPTLEATWGSLSSNPAFRLESLIAAGMVDVLTSLPPGTKLEWNGHG